jgi:hypothetical protein
MNIVVSTVTRLLVGESRVRIPTGKENFLFSKTSKLTAEPTEPRIQLGRLFVPRFKAAGAWN